MYKDSQNELVNVKYNNHIQVIWLGQDKMVIVQMVFYKMNNLQLDTEDVSPKD